MTTHTKEPWEIEFDALCGIIPGRWDLQQTYTFEQATFKKFIKETLQSRDREIVGMLEEIQSHYEYKGNEYVALEILKDRIQGV